MNPLRGLLLTALFLLMLFGAFLWLKPQMPALIPTHWNAQGHIDGYMTPFMAVLVPMVLIGFIGLLTLMLPAISPRGFGMKAFAPAFAISMLAAQAFLVVVAIGVLLNGAGHSMRQPLIAVVGMGLLWMVIGNYLGKFQKNFFAGIRTPWTLANDEVWERTHRMAGWLFMLTGLMVVIVAFAGASPMVAVCLFIASALIPAVYSYVIYRKVEKNLR